MSEKVINSRYEEELLSGSETFCAAHDAMDELKIMELLDLPLEVYDTARI